MDFQTAFDAVIALIGFMGGWILNSLKDSIDSLRVSENSLRKEIQEMQVLIVGDYVKRSDMERIVTSIVSKLDSIDEKLTEFMIKQGQK
jgi:hypothetical protein